MLKVKPKEDLIIMFKNDKEKVSFNKIFAEKYQYLYTRSSLQSNEKKGNKK